MRNSKSKPKVLLLSLPWTSLTEPSLGLGILKAQLKNEGFESTIRHLNILLLKYIRATTYVAIANTFGINDFLFTKIFEEDISDIQMTSIRNRAIEALTYHFSDERYKTDEDFVQLILRLRNEIIPLFLNDCLDEIGRLDASVIGFTCMFDQTLASLALAKMVKERYPEKFIMLGGYALEGAPGNQVMESFSFIDCICYGEGEKVIGDIVRGSQERQLLSLIPNLMYREFNYSNVSRTPFTKKTINMDDSPLPDYYDFFEDIKRLKQKEDIEIKWNFLPVETSRGCWWGQVKHCIFCGIDDETMHYRQRSVENTLKIFDGLYKYYGTKCIRISDYILPNSYYKTLLPILAQFEQEDKYTLTCEMKANVSVEDFKLLRDAGFIEVQPGIESFSSNVLKKIDKGVTAIQNVYCLLLGHKTGIKVNHNFIYGFPDDSEEDYIKMLTIIPCLYHLSPPASVVEVAITRFAPLQTDPERFKIPNCTEPLDAYDVIFSKVFMIKHNFRMSDYCYYFKPTYVLPASLKTTFKYLRYQMASWAKEAKSRSVRLSYSLDNGYLKFSDTRFSEIPKELVYDNTFAQVYLECTERITHLSSLVEKLKKDLTIDQISSRIDTLVNDRFLFREGDHFIGLALNNQEYAKLDGIAEEFSSKKWAKPYV